MDASTPRLIEAAFPLKQASLDSVHEKNVRHGHISTLHIWPARRPLAASRAALIATLLPDPGTEVERKRLLELLGGVVKMANTFKNVGGREVPTIKEFTEGGILHWGQENGPALDYFREEIKKAYGGRAPRVLDPFAGGGAIPLEAMRLGCEVTAIDINPVAWFILKCTLEYPQRLAGQTRPLPRFALESEEFMSAYWKSKGNGRKGRGKKQEATQPSMLEAPDADLSWHVRAWGHWVLERARRDLDRFYPTVDGRPTVAYLWARTVTCKNCRATIPLLKTLWLCKKDNKRILLKMKPRSDRTGVDFDVVQEPLKGRNAAQRRAHDQEVGRGTVTGRGAICPCCSTGNAVAVTLEDIQRDFRAGPSGVQLTCIVKDTEHGKDYIPPDEIQIKVSLDASECSESVAQVLPFGILIEPIDPTRPSPNARGLSGLPVYGLDTFGDLFTSRQLLSLATIGANTRNACVEMQKNEYPTEWVEAILSYLALAIDRLADYNSALCHWSVTRETITNTFQRYALRLNWDFVEVNPLATTTGSYLGAVDWICQVVRHILNAHTNSPRPYIHHDSATELNLKLEGRFDAIVTDPPYYDAIPYSDLSDFFYVWLRRVIGDRWVEEFSSPLTNKEPELVEHSRFGHTNSGARNHYESGMTRSFTSMHSLLKDSGRLVVVFANKQPSAWESLVSGIIRSGFVVVASWPIQTEMPNKAARGARLSSSIWLVCRKRSETARPGWDTQVLEEMRENIYEKLRQFWDAGIRGPDFVWAATGPALEAYSKHPVVKKADEPNSLMTVSEFLQHVRRIVVDYVVGRILSQNGYSEDASTLDDVTLYYLLHRHDFGLNEAPVGASILYAQSCNLRDRDLADRFDLLSYGKSRAAAEVDDEDEAGEGGDAQEEEAATSGSTVKLKRWDQRRRRDLGINAGARPAPMVDQAHHIMHLWRAGDVHRVDAYIEDQGLRRNPVFPRLLQALIELAGKDNQHDERSLLESIMNHVTSRGAHPQMRMPIGEG